MWSIWEPVWRRRRRRRRRRRERRRQRRRSHSVTATTAACLCQTAGSRVNRLRVGVGRCREVSSGLWADTSLVLPLLVGSAPAANRPVCHQLRALWHIVCNQGKKDRSRGRQKPLFCPFVIKWNDKLAENCNASLGILHEFTFLVSLSSRRLIAFGPARILKEKKEKNKHSSLC